MKWNTTIINHPITHQLAFAARCTSKIPGAKVITCFLLISSVPLAGLADPFLPQVWQKPVKTGPLTNQFKHVGWVRDQNGDFIDDALDALAASQTTSVILQLSQCLDPAALRARFSPYGTVRRTGVLVAYVIIDGVRKQDLAALAADPLVAAVEKPRPMRAFLDTSTRVIRARPSITAGGEDFATLTGKNGSGVNIAIVDTGVDDLVHNAFAGKFKSGFNAITTTAGNPPDDNSAGLAGPFIDTGPDGICNTHAAMDDVQAIAFGSSALGLCVASGPNGLIGTIAGSDDVSGTFSFGMVFNPACPFQAIAVGPNGICNSAATGDDIQIVPVGQRVPNAPCITAGANGVINTVPGGDDRLQGATHHGTHVAGTALGMGVGPGCRNANDGSAPNNCAGVAPGAGLVDVKVLNDMGSAPDDCQIIDGLEWLWMDGMANVVNISLGEDDNVADGTDTISHVIDALVDRGITVVVAAGNSGANCLGRIAASDLAITVANADDRGTIDRADDVIHFSSTFGPRADLAANMASPTVGMLKPDLAAPGADIDAALGGTANGYHRLTGTSMASPHVAGAVALLLSWKPELTPGAIKDLLKRTAFQTPQYLAAGASFPGIDSRYNTRWGYGLLDIYQAAFELQSGITDVGFPSCVGANNDYPNNRLCKIAGKPPTVVWENSTDITLATDPPVQGQPNTITVFVKNFGGSAADNVVVTVTVANCVANGHNFSLVGSKTIGTIGPALTASVSIPWTPALGVEHQCIKATIDYAFDTDFADNATQRNIYHVNTASPRSAFFYVGNPYNETSTVTLQLTTDALTKTNFNPVLSATNFTLTPYDCARLETVQFFSGNNVPVGATGMVRVAATLITPRHTNATPVSGVSFALVRVAPGLQRAYSVGLHGPEGIINIPLALAGTPTTDPRRCVQAAKAVFNVPVTAKGGGNPLVSVTSQSGSMVPPFVASFAGGAASGTELTIQFTQPLLNSNLYTFEFVNGVVNSDGSPLTSDSNFQLRVLHGDVNSSGLVTATDVSFVSSLTNRVAAFGNTSVADVNQDGVVNQDDVFYVSDQVSGNMPHIRITRAGSLMRLSWERGDFMLQATPTLTGPTWTTNVGATTSVECDTRTATINPTNNMRFFRLIKP